MSQFTFLTFDADYRRWWVLRGEHAAVSLTAFPLSPTAPTLATDITGPDGTPLMPECVDVHRPGGGWTNCPALGRDCDGGTEDLSGAREALEEWAAAGHDDAILRRALERVYAQEVSA